MSTELVLLEQQVVASDDKGDLLGSCIAWEGEPVRGTADEMLGVDRKEPTAKADAVEFLRTILADGPMKASEVEKEAQTACLLRDNQSISQSKPFRSARKELGIEPYQPKGQKAGGWFWALSGDQMPSDGSDAFQNKRAPDESVGT
jgi:hypothetical protein